MVKTCHSTVVAAPAERVWRAIRDFHDVSWALGVLESCVPVGDLRGDQIGACRILNGCFHETLLTLDDQNLTIKYSLDNGPSPVSPADVQHFLAEVRIRPVTDTGAAFVEWSATWEAKDDAAVGFASEFYRPLLAALKKKFSSGGIGAEAP